jgi:effector-binding domain-containing protein
VSNRVLEVSTKSIDDQLVASLRFHGSARDIPTYFGKLYEVVKPWVCGKAICLYHTNSGNDMHELEVCFPVSQQVRVGHVKSRVLQGGSMLCTPHPGSRDLLTGPSSLQETWRNFRTYILDTGIGMGPGPAREVYRFDGNGSADEGYMAELQVPCTHSVPCSR